jgi:hypothetical protein
MQIRKIPPASYFWREFVSVRSLETNCSLKLDNFEKNLGRVGGKDKGKGRFKRIRAKG